VTLNFATCTYSEFKPDMGIPVRTTVGAPRWFPHKDMAHWKNASPLPYMLNMPIDQYREHYLAMLDKHGADVLYDDAHFIQQQFEQQSKYPSDRVVILCFDNLSKPGNWCHRTMWAQWWTRNTGFDVEELGKTLPQAPPPPPPPPTLF
jgi:hypothetical protein